MKELGLDGSSLGALVKGATIEESLPVGAIEADDPEPAQAEDAPESESAEAA